MHSPRAVEAALAGIAHDIRTPLTGIVALAELLGGHPLRGSVVALGGQRFGFGDLLSAPVAAAVPQLGVAISDAIEHVRTGRAPVPGGAPCA